jgi:hypothetical protein
MGFIKSSEIKTRDIFSIEGLESNNAIDIVLTHTDHVSKSKTEDSDILKTLDEIINYFVNDEFIKDSLTSESGKFEVSTKLLFTFVFQLA